MVSLPSLLYSQFYSSDSIVNIFNNELNKYRNSQSLTSFVLEPKYKNFVDKHSKYQAKLGYNTHGEGENSLQKRYDREPSLQNLACQENCTMVLMSDFNDLNYLSSQILKHFKNSPQHNKGLVNPKFNKMYLSCYKNGEYVYVTLLMSE